MNESGIYRIINLVNNKIYIGSAVNFKKRKHKHFWELKNNRHHSSYLQNSYNKHGKQNFKYEIILNCERSELEQAEQYLIDFYQPDYNMCKIVGTRLGVKVSEKTKLKMSIAQKGRIHSIETRKKLSTAHMGMKQSKTTIEKRVSKLRGRKRTPELIEMLKGFSEKPVLQFSVTGEFIAEYHSLASAGKSVGVSGDAIGNNLKNRCLTSGGYIWKYKNIIQCP